MKLAIVTVPFHGHTDILEQAIPNVDTTYIISGWKDIHLRRILPNSYEISKISIHGSSPADFTFSRILANVEDVISLLEKIDPDAILYDFFAIEGYIAGKKLGIPTICSIPAILPYEKDDLMLE